MEPPRRATTEGRIGPTTCALSPGRHTAPQTGDTVETAGRQAGAAGGVRRAGRGVGGEAT